MDIINLTPHEINFYGEGGNTVKFSLPPSGTVARAAAKRTQIYRINDVPVYQVKYGQITGLPEPKAGTIYIVSAIVAKAVPGRSDVYIVDGAVRDESGKVIGCLGLAQIQLQ